MLPGVSTSASKTMSFGFVSFVFLEQVGETLQLLNFSSIFSLSESSSIFLDYRYCMRYEKRVICFLSSLMLRCRETAAFRLLWLAMLFSFSSVYFCFNKALCFYLSALTYWIACWLYFYSLALILVVSSVIFCYCYPDRSALAWNFSFFSSIYLRMALYLAYICSFSASESGSS